MLCHGTFVGWTGLQASPVSPSPTVCRINVLSARVLCPPLPSGKLRGVTDYIAKSQVCRGFISRSKCLKSIFEALSVQVSSCIVEIRLYFGPVNMLQVLC